MLGSTHADFIGPKILPPEAFLGCLPRFALLEARAAQRRRVRGDRRRMPEGHRTPPPFDVLLPTALARQRSCHIFQSGKHDHFLEPKGFGPKTRRVDGALQPVAEE